MWRVVRLSLMWLLAAALPLQGLSAATMLACGAGQHDHTATQVASHLHANMTPALHSHTHTHTHVADVSEHDHAGVDHSQRGSAGLDTGGIQKCSACASCCVSAVLASEIISFDPVKLTESFAPPVAYTLAVFVPEGLERPPRLFLA